MQTRITELLNIKYPIFQGGMAWVADGDLAAELCGVRPHSPIGRDRGLKILVFWVRVPVGALR